jgi:hypothetical protein
VFVRSDHTLAVQSPLDILNTSAFDGEVGVGVVSVHVAVPVIDIVAQANLVGVTSRGLGFNFQAVADSSSLVNVKHVHGHRHLLSSRHLDFHSNGVVTVSEIGASQFAVETQGVDAAFNVDGSSRFF